MSENKTNTSITFKPTTQGLQPYTHPYNPQQTIQTIKEAIATHYSVQYHQIKLIHKGKILIDRLTACQSHIEGAVVMLVIGKRMQSPKKNNADQTIPKIPNSFNTGMGGALPVGFGGYSMINHPQYMSAISGAVNQQKIDEMLNDPMYVSMMQQMMQDPDTIRSMIEENPMLKSMFKDNPSMKMILDNPQMLKALFNPEMIKMSREMMKNQGNGTMPSMQNLQAMQQQIGQSGGLGGLGALGGLGGLGGFGGLGNMGGLYGVPQMNPPQQGQQNTNTNPQTGLPNMNPMMNGFNNAFLLNNPYLQQLRQQLLQTQQQSQQQSKSSEVPKQLPIEQKYKNQLKQLQSMGFKDRQQNIKALIESKGDVDGAIERLCQD